MENCMWSRARMSLPEWKCNKYPFYSGFNHLIFVSVTNWMSSFISFVAFAKTTVFKIMQKINIIIQNYSFCLLIGLVEIQRIQLNGRNLRRSTEGRWESGIWSHMLSQAKAGEIRQRFYRSLEIFDLGFWVSPKTQFLRQWRGQKK